jgi:hypothetical protein
MICLMNGYSMVAALRVCTKELALLRGIGVVFTMSAIQIRKNGEDVRIDMAK